jgi:Sec-independent protein translocase protein TatA
MVLCSPLAYLMPSTGEMIIILVVGLLIFGRDLPAVGKKVARTIVDLKRGMHQFRAQLESDPDLREARDTMQDLRRDLTEPARELTAPLQDAAAPFREAAAAVSEAEPLLADPRNVFANLTDEALATPGPDATQVAPPPARSAFELAAGALPPPPAAATTEPAG